MKNIASATVPTFNDSGRLAPLLEPVWTNE